MLDNTVAGGIWFYPHDGVLSGLRKGSCIEKSLESETCSTHQSSNRHALGTSYVLSCRISQACAHSLLAHVEHKSVSAWISQIDFYYANNHVDGEMNPSPTPIFNPEDHIGKKILMDKKEDGCQTRETIVRLIEDHESSIQDNPVRIKNSPITQ
jgi:galactitol-specific phosphotransferase system IIB component